MNRLPLHRVRPLLAVFALLLAGCGTLSPREQARAGEIVHAAQPTALDCEREDHCALPSELMQLADADARQDEAASPIHHATVLDIGSDALLVRLHLIRAARESIDLQTYIFDEDDSARMVLDELVAAARRGVKVRLMMDQLSAMKSANTLAALAGVHANFEARIYNPVFNKGPLNWADYAAATLCCFRKLNRRMHSKLLLVDGKVAITGGRNYQDDYFDWDAEFNFRDRDLLLTGPQTRAMAANFEAFWRSPRAVPVAHLRDVARILRRRGVPALPQRAYERPERVRRMQADAGDAQQLRERILSGSVPVRGVEFVGDLPQKHRDDAQPEVAAPSTPVLHALVASTQRELLMQTPYLVFSKTASRMFSELQQGLQPPRIVVSTNSLAATDAFMVYALSHKYKRRYLRKYGFEIYEYKARPTDAPVRDETEAAWRDAEDETQQLRNALRNAQRESASAREYGVRRRILLSGNSRAAVLSRPGMRMGLHAKSLVVDERVAVIGTHNFDPRGDDLNTESAVIIRDPAFARVLADSIRRDINPRNSWVIAPRERTFLFPGLNYSLLKVSENLPLFDLVPLRYATSYEFMPGPHCPHPLSIGDPDFQRCYRVVGDFPDVELGPKWLLTRFLTAFGAGLAPIL